MKRRELIKQAVVASQVAAGRCRATIAELHHLEDLAAASRLLNSIWSVPDDRPMLAPELLRALSKAGNYLAMAFVNEDLAGAVVGFLGQDESGCYLHSHILGVVPEMQGRNVGFALKQHQRAWALERGIKKVTWTFDPLVRRNAFFNITKLGAEATAYFPNFYGKMIDGVNAGDESDRLLITWWLGSRLATAASENRLEEPELEALSSAGGLRILFEDAGEAPVPGQQASGATLLCAVPQDIVELRRRNPEKAAAWRSALRGALGGALDEGYVVSAFARSGYYVLTKS